MQAYGVQCFAMQLPRLPAIILTAACAILATTAAAGAVPAPAPTPTPGRVAATLTTCHVSAELADRYATFAAQMVATPATQEMSLRLQLYEHTAGTPGYRLITGVPGFGVWESSAPGIGVFNYSQEVTSLVAPASFRVQVGYRWLDASRRVIRRTTRTTVACAEPAQLATLVAGAVSISPGPSAGSATYDVTVRNDGGQAAGPFAVSLSVAGTPLADQTIADLEPASRTVVEFAGPACPAGGTLAVAVDPAGRVPQSTTVGDTRIVTCR
jgi:CARDB protein